jgi:hypothetical protein
LPQFGIHIWVRSLASEVKIWFAAYCLGLSWHYNFNSTSWCQWAWLGYSWLSYVIIQ